MKDLNWGDLDSNGVQLRPHIVWFGEMVPEMETAIALTKNADIFLIIGTSMQVYPAAGLVDFIPSGCIVFVIDPQLENRFSAQENFFKTSATEGMKRLREILLKELV